MREVYRMVDAGEVEARRWGVDGGSAGGALGQERPLGVSIFAWGPHFP